MFFLTKAEKYFLVEASLGQICGNEESLQAFNNGCSSKLSLRLILKSTTFVAEPSATARSSGLYWPISS
jgi:hypothetical protein